MQAAHALVVGEALLDVVSGPDGTTTQYAGGSAANVAVALARLGRLVRLATALADDDRGRMIVEHLATAGVRLAGDPHVLARTSTARATLGADGSASYEFDIEWRLPAFDVTPPGVVHVCSLGAVLRPGADDVLALLTELPPATFVSYDVNARPSITGSGPDVVARVEEVARRATLVKASDEDLRALYPEHDVEGAARHLLDLGIPTVVVTEGAGGARWFSATGDAVRMAAAPALAVDTTGAGDTFAAALIDALWDDPGRRPQEVLGHAVRAAAVTVSRPGADPPYRHELRPGGRPTSARHA